MHNYELQAQYAIYSHMHVTCAYTYIHTYIHACMHAYIHTYIHTSMQYRTICNICIHVKQSKQDRYIYIASLNFRIFNGTLHSFFRDFWISEQIKPLQLLGQAAEFKLESKTEPLLFIWHWFPKAMPENNQRIWLQNQRPSSWSTRSSAQEHLGILGHHVCLRQI